MEREREVDHGKAMGQEKLPGRVRAQWRGRSPSMGEIRSPLLSLAAYPSLCAALAHLLSLRAAFSLLPTAGEAKSAPSARVTLSASLHPKALYAPPPRAEKRLIFGHETAFWHESGSFRRRVDPVEIADLGFRYEGTRFWSEGAQSLCQNAVSWPKIGQSSACGVRVTFSRLQVNASARGRACSLRWGKPDKGVPLGAGEGRSRERAKRGDRVGAGGG